MGAAHRRRRLALGRLPARLQGARKPPPPRRRARPRIRQAARPRWRMAHRKTAPALGRARRVRTGRATSRRARHGRLQQRQQRGRGLLRGEPEKRLALERLQSVFASGAGPPQPHRVDRNRHRPAGAGARRQCSTALRGRGALARRAARARVGGTRGGAERRQRWLAGHSSALGHRPGRFAAAARHHSATPPARCGREPAGPPADPRGVQGAGRDHAQCAWSTRSSAAAP